MKKYIIMLTIIVIIPIFCLPVSAEELTDEYLSEFENILPDWLSGVTEDTDRLLDSVGIRGIISEIVCALKGDEGRIASFALMLVGCVALTSLAGAMGGKTGESASSAVGVICSTLIFGVLSDAFMDISSSFEELNRFFGSLIPISASVIAFGGGVQSAAVSAGGMYLTMHLVGSFGQQFMFAIAALGLGISLLTSVGDGGVGSVARGIRSVFFWILGIFTAVIGAGFALQTSVASAKDSMTVRAAKYMASGLVPFFPDHGYPENDLSAGRRQSADCFRSSDALPDHCTRAEKKGSSAGFYRL